MTYKKVLPPAPLRPFIQSFSYWEGGAPNGDLLCVTAMRALSLQINLYDDELRWYDASGDCCQRLKGFTIAGPQSRPFAVDAMQRRIVRVTFRPAGAYPFLRMPLSELHDDHVSLEDIWGRGARTLHARLAEARTPDAVFELLGSELLAGAQNGVEIDPFISSALLSCARSLHRVTATQLALDAGMRPKRFIEKFSREVGLTPKLYLRIARFERVLEVIYSREHVDWAYVAAEHGYSDQSHLIRDFHEFAGLTPGSYFERRGPAAHHATSKVRA
jgi:AraC-like DNA-binding protein